MPTPPATDIQNRAFFTTLVPGELNAAGQPIRFVNYGEPNQDMFARLFRSVPFKMEFITDRAMTIAQNNYGGLVKIAADSDAKSGTDKGGDADAAHWTTVIVPHQVPTVNAGAAIVIGTAYNDSPITVIVDGSIASRNNFLLTFKADFVTWLTSATVPQGGTAGQVLVKTGSSDYQMTWSTPGSSVIPSTVVQAPTTNGSGDFSGGDLSVSNSVSGLVTTYIPTLSAAFWTWLNGALTTLTSGLSSLSSTVSTLSTTVSNLIPSQTGNAGKYLTTNGSSVSWASISIPSVTRTIGLASIAPSQGANNFGVDWTIDIIGTIKTLRLSILNNTWVSNGAGSLVLDLTSILGSNTIDTNGVQCAAVNVVDTTVPGSPFGYVTVNNNHSVIINFTEGSSNTHTISVQTQITLRLN